jgi:hypothetical protein
MHHYHYTEYINMCGGEMQGVKWPGGTPLGRRCKNTGIQIVWGEEIFNIVGPNISGSSLWIMIHVIFLVTRIVKWILDFIFGICALVQKWLTGLRHLQFHSYYLQIIAQYQPVMRNCRFWVTNVVENYTIEVAAFVYDNYVYQRFTVFGIGWFVADSWLNNGQCYQQKRDYFPTSKPENHLYGWTVYFELNWLFITNKCT